MYSNFPLKEVLQDFRNIIVFSTSYKVFFNVSGGLFNLAVRLMQLFSQDVHNYEELTSLLGLYFQIRDDYANLCLEEYAVNKSFAEDLTEGKFSFPIVHAIQ